MEYMNNSNYNTYLSNAFLDVNCSLSNKVWKERSADNNLIEEMKNKSGITSSLAKILVSRGIMTSEIETYLNPKLRKDLPDPKVLTDMEKASIRFANAIIEKENIAIYGDYDVDGATSSALLNRFISSLGHSANVYIPDRVNEGYGPNISAFKKLIKNGVSLIITVDCGIAAFEPLLFAKNKGLDVIVVDHHMAQDKLPEAFSIINPNRKDDKSKLGMLAAVGVSFMLTIATNTYLRQKNYYSRTIKEPDLLMLLDLVALGTICDLVPLVGLNRTFVVKGLEVMNLKNNLGLNALSKITKIKEKINTYHAGFILGPRINAGGRVGEPDLGARLLATSDNYEAMQLSTLLDQYNIKRKDIEDNVFQEAVNKVENEKNFLDNLFIIVKGSNWHEGVIGIVASRLVEKYSKPSIVISTNGENAKGSARSIPGIDIGYLISIAKQKNIIEKGGGHPMAAGLEVLNRKINQFSKFMNKSKIENNYYVEDLNEYFIDSIITTSGATKELYTSFQSAGPFGVGNREPRFAISNVNIIYSQIVGKNHIVARISDSSGNYLKAIAFRSLNTPLGDAILQKRNMHLVGRLKNSYWNGKSSMELYIEDGALIG